MMIPANRPPLEKPVVVEDIDSTFNVLFRLLSL